MRSLHTTTREQPPLTATRESPHTAPKPQCNQNKQVLHLVVPALSRLRPPGSIVQAADPQTPIGLQSRLLLRLWPQELPCSTVVSGLRNFLHSRPPQHAMPLGLRPQPPPTPLRQPEEGRLEQQLLRRTHGQRVPRHPSDRGT